MKTRTGLWFLVTLVVLIAANAAKGAERRILVHGHRGTRGTRPENTLPAFKEAVADGVDFLELDLHLSKDGILIISHDPAIAGDKCRDPKGQIVKTPILIRDLTAKEIRSYDCGSVPLPDFPEQRLVPHTPKPTFEELVAWVSKNAPKVRLNIETKMDEPREDLNPDPGKFVREITRILKKYHRAVGSLLQSFDFRTLEAARTIAPELKRVCLFETSPAAGNMCDIAKGLGAVAISPQFSLVTRENVDKCHGKGIDVVPWTVDRVADWEKMVHLGVDAIITDYPKKLISYLKEHSVR